MKTGVGIALAAQAVGLCYAVYREEKMEAVLIGASMVTTYFATRERARAEAAHENRMQTLEGYVSQLRQLGGLRY